MALYELPVPKSLKIVLACAVVIAENSTVAMVPMSKDIRRLIPIVTLLEYVRFMVSPSFRQICDRLSDAHETNCPESSDSNLQYVS